MSTGRITGRETPTVEGTPMTFGDVAVTGVISGVPAVGLLLIACNLRVWWRSSGTESRRALACALVGIAVQAWGMWMLATFEAP